jgi:hypothetical protein
MMQHYPRDQAVFAGSGPMVPGLAQILGLLAGDKEYVEELLEKILGNRKRLEEAARKRERRDQITAWSESRSALKSPRP